MRAGKILVGVSTLFGIGGTIAGLVIPTLPAVKDELVAVGAPGWVYPVAGMTLGSLVIIGRNAQELLAVWRSGKTDGERQAIAVAAAAAPAERDVLIELAGEPHQPSAGAFAAAGPDASG